jgi:hypothetical protein
MTSKPVPKTFGLKKVLQAPPCCQRHLVARLEKKIVFLLEKTIQAFSKENQKICSRHLWFFPK